MLIHSDYKKKKKMKRKKKKMIPGTESVASVSHLFLHVETT